MYFDQDTVTFVFAREARNSITALKQHSMGLRLIYIYILSILLQSIEYEFLYGIIIWNEIILLT